METITETPINSENLIQPEGHEEVKATRRNIRPAEINARASQLQQENRLPPKPGNNVNDVQLQQWLDLLTPTMWDNMMIYVNRSFPIINRKMSNPDANKYIDVLTKDSIDASGGTIRKCILNNHGGGKYIIYVNDTNRKGENQNVFEAWCTIPLDEADPKINIEELEIHNNKNAGFVTHLQNKGILDAQKRILKGGVVGGATGNGGIGGNGNGDTIAAVGQLFNQFATTFSRLNPQQKEDLGKNGINELFIEKLKQDDPNKQLAMFTTLIAAMQGMIPKPDTSNTLGMKDIVQMMSSAHEKQMDMFKLLLTQQSESRNNGKDEDSDLDKLIKWKTALPELFGRGRGSNPEEREKSTAEIVVDAIKEIGLPVLGLASQMIQLKTGVAPIIPTNEAQARAMANGAGMGGIQQQYQPQPQQLPAPVPNSNVVTMPSPTGEPVPKEATPDPDIVFFQSLLNSYGMMIINALKAGQTGVDVGEHVKSLAPMIGQDVHALICAKGRDKMLIGMKSIPEFWQQTGELYGEAKMVTFIDEFIRFEEILAEEIDEEDRDEAEGTETTLPGKGV